MGLPRLGFTLVIALFAASQAQSQDEAAFPTETEVKLLLTRQTAR